MYTHGKAVSTASYFEIDDVIDPADSRRWIATALAAAPAPPPPRQETPMHRHLVIPPFGNWFGKTALQRAFTESVAEFAR